MNRRRTVGRIVGLVGAVGLIAILGSVAVSVAAGIPTEGTLVYSGFVEEDGQAPARALAIAVELHESETSVVAFCRVALSDPLPVAAKGRFRVDLGADPRCLDAVRDNPNLYVEVQAAGVMLPRTKLSATPYAVEAERSATQPIVTGWVVYDPTPSVLFGGALPAGQHSTQGAWRREGDSVHVRISTTLAGPTSAGTYAWSLPNSHAVDFASAGVIGNLGSGIVGKAGIPSTAVYVAVRSDSPTVVFARYPSGDVTDQVPITSQADVYIQLELSVPVAGWTTTTGGN